jgi:hypothetical protein
MSGAPIQTQSSTATSTQGFGGRLGTRLSQPSDASTRLPRFGPGALGESADELRHVLAAFHALDVHSQGLGGFAGDIVAFVGHCEQRPLGERPPTGAETGRSGTLRQEGRGTVLALCVESALADEALGARWLSFLPQVRSCAGALRERFLAWIGHGLSRQAETSSFGETEEEQEEDLETVDWDVRIETPPSRPFRRVLMDFQKGSYRRPRIVDDPED